jgi:hypothetical protein
LGRTADALHHPLTRVSWSWDAINLVFLWPDGEWDWDGVYFSVKDNSPANLSSQYNSRTYDSDDPDCSSIVQQWLEECTTKHPKRERLRDKAWFPSRLLDLRATDSDAIRLLDTSKAPPIGPYMTLSHSWGGAPIAQLERSNSDDFERHMLLESFPKTFREAIAVVRSLDVRYLWIDSLCIIQDAPDDWVHQASLMSQVYRNALCNIGATASADSHGGLFRQRDPSLIATCRIEVQGQAHEIIWEDGMNIDADSSSPLLRRAWVAQERWLCPRMLHFAAEQIHWECRTYRACEPSPQFLDAGEFLHLKDDQGVIADEAEREPEMNEPVRDQMTALWLKLVQSSTYRQLTFATDKLVAFSGIAKTFAEMRGVYDECIAGLWKSHFLADMLWTLPDN